MGVWKYWNQLTRSGRLRNSSATLPATPTAAVQSATSRHRVMFQICGYSELCTCAGHAPCQPGDAHCAAVFLIHTRHVGANPSIRSSQCC